MLKCSICGNKVTPTGVILDSLPEKYEYKCDGCSRKYLYGKLPVVDNKSMDLIFYMFGEFFTDIEGLVAKHLPTLKEGAEGEVIVVYIGGIEIMKWKKDGL